VPEILGRLTWILNRNPPVRVASRAVVLQCLSFLALHYTKPFCDYFRLTELKSEPEGSDGQLTGSSAKIKEAQPRSSYTQSQHTMKELLQFVTFSDPLIRGSLAHIIACFISGVLRDPHMAVATGDTDVKGEEQQQQKKESVLVSEVINIKVLVEDYLLKLLLDESANVRKMVCRALVTCFNDILASPYARSGITILYTLIDSIREDTYWLVKTEVSLSPLIS